MNFVKKNIIFVIVMALTLLGALFLIYLDWTKHDAISSANELTQKSQRDFDAAFKKGAKPVELNIKMIQNDTEELKKKTVQLQRVFGKPYRKALLDFAAALKVTEDELYSRMRQLFNDDNEKVKTADVLIPKLFAGLEKDKKLSSAEVMNEYKKFISQVQKETVEDFASLEAGYDILGEALGLSRTMSPSMAHVYLGQMQRKIRSQRMIPGVTSLQIVQNFTFNQFIQTFPSNEAVQDILSTMPVYEDIFRRMNASRLESVIHFARLGQPVKIAGDRYMEYQFSTTVTGSMGSVRNFMNSLLNAYKENRVYVITWVALSSPDSAEEVEKVRGRVSGPVQNAQNPPDFSANPEVRRRPGRRRFDSSGRTAQQDNVSRLRQPLSEMEAEMQPDYGSVVIGKNSMIRADFSFKYYCYIGDRLKK